MLTRWHQRAGGDWHGALRGWRYGSAGLRGEVGNQYAAAVLSRCEGEL